MRILIASSHRYPASRGGPGGGSVLDCLAKGLAELGHTVYYYLEQGVGAPLPRCVIAVDENLPAVDIAHVYQDRLIEKLGIRVPCVRTRHADSMLRGLPRTDTGPGVVYVSRTLARTYGSDRYVWNGIDPEEFLYSERKSNYVLFLCALERARAKGLEVAINAAARAGVPLWVGGSSSDPQLVREFAELFAQRGVTYLGGIHGEERARRLADARALLFPVEWNEAFGLVVAEAMMSGTPVIGSRNGACPELITPDVGFLCSTEEEYVRAIERACEIPPAACRAKAMREFHYLRMARDYVREYERVLGRNVAALSR